MNVYAATPRQVSLARQWVRGLLAHRVDDDTGYDVALCAGELVDNARKHGRSDGKITVSVFMDAGLVRLEVMDDGSAATVPRVTNNVATEDGHGLKIIANVAGRWGRHKDQDLHQIVWCEFSLPNMKGKGRGNDGSA